MSTNDLTQVRDYIKTRMSSVQPSYQEWTGSLEDIGNIPQTLLDSTFHITLGVDSSSSQSDRHVEDNFAVTLTTFKRGYTSPVDARDQALQIANCIRLDIINPLNIEAYKSANDGNIEDVQSVSITPTEIDLSNDNIIKIQTELNVRLFIGVT